MTRPTISMDPADRLGVYKRLDQVPDRHRLHQYSAKYRGQDTWQEFAEEHEYAQGSGDRYKAEVDRVGDRWKAFMTNRDRHHALATPLDVNGWCSDLLDQHTDRRAYDIWVRVKRFYTWLAWHADHPHVYNPVLMAAKQHPAAADIWWEMAGQALARREAYREQANE